ncbi:MAG TPA: SMC family ATPase [Actinomycetota bacterium]
MRVVELSLRNYRVYEELDLELPARVIGIFGPNGAGKSTIVESILWALYGRARTPKGEIRTHGLLTDCEVRIVFEHGGSQYEVRRWIRGKNHATGAELFLADLQLAAGVTEVDAEIQRLLRMDQQVFRSSVFAEQKQLDAFSDVTPGKRKEMVLRLLGIKPVDDARAAARREVRARSEGWKQLALALPEIGELEARLKEATSVAAEASASAKAAAAELKAETARAAKALKAFERSDRARQRVEKLAERRAAQAQEVERLGVDREDRVERMERLQKALVELPGFEEELASLEGVETLFRAAERWVEESSKLMKANARLAALPAVDAAVALAELEGADDRARDAQRAVAEARARRDHDVGLHAAAVDRQERAAEADPAEPCPTCGRELGNDFSAYVRHCKREVAAAKKRLTDAERAVRQAETARRKAESERAKAAAAGESARRTAEERARAEEETAALEDAVRELAAAFDGGPPDRDRLQAGVQRAKELAAEIAVLRAEGKHLEQAERDLAKLEARLAELATSLAAIDAEAAGLSFDQLEHVRVRAERDEAVEARDRTAIVDRDAAAALAEARLTVSELEGEVKQAKETAARLEQLRGEARYVDSVATLLDGFRDHLVARIGPELSREAGALFRELTNAEYEDLRIQEEELRIEIADGDRYFGIERFSGSETDLANLALRVAISMHLSRVSGADVGMMVLDEVLGSLDVERKDLMVNAMGRLAGRFHQLFVITHAEQVKDQFPAAIEVRRIGRRRSVAELV